VHCPTGQKPPAASQTEVNRKAGGGARPVAEFA
jgi:hypothetical protein